jgi:membrane peptidoglycan carboxypeptidase
MNENMNGYVVYYKDRDRKLPLGVVSEDYECNANSDYIPTKLKDYLVQIEDKRFYEHSGIDFKGITRAGIENLKAGRIVQGGSTITQQLARNLLKDNSRSLSRKLQETLKALKIESNFTKDEILNLYFNNIYFGKNLRGIRTAGLYYFGKEIDKLTQVELLYLLTILRGPNYYTNQPDKANRRLQFISKTLLDRKIISKSRHQKNIKTKLFFKDNFLQTIRNQAIPFIIESKNNKQKKIVTTIDVNIQDFVKKFVTDSKYPVSLVAIRNSKVVAFASSYGTDYPFISKSNVGSTLKPFLYCHLRDSGISTTEKFNSYKNDLNWDVREVAYHKAFLNLEEALFYSNNNSFLNASNKLKLESSLNFLAIIFKKEISEFYPSSILGATKNGISLYELAYAYSTFFNPLNLSQTKIECLSILNRIFQEKLGLIIENAFLKTGTTNDNKERYAILGNPEITFAVLRNENALNDASKEGGFMKQISRHFSLYFKSQNNYKWI